MALSATAPSPSPSGGGTADLVDRFAGLPVTVVGEAMLDSWMEGRTSRLCPEAPVPVVDVLGRTDAPGGPANVAVNARSLGAEVRFVSVIGDDPEGELARRCLQGRGLDDRDLLVQSGRRTLTKSRITADRQILIRVDHGDTGPIDRFTERALLDRLTEAFVQSRAVIVSDYGYGLMTPTVVAHLAALQRDRARILVLDAKDPTAYVDVGVTAVKPNFAQAMRLLGVPDGDTGQGSDRAASVIEVGDRLLELLGAEIVAVTLDAEGAVILERGRPAHRTYADPVRSSTTAGAGDTFSAAFALALAVGAQTPTAAEIASAAASVVVAKPGTASCTPTELRQVLSPAAKRLDRESLGERMEAYRRQGKRIVFTNGCFDILHRGHIAYLNRAKELGDVLVIGVNDDAGVRRLKGPDRPINALEDRIEVLAALSSTDHVVPFREETPAELIRAIRPDVFVKGGDYSVERLPEASLVQALGGRVWILPFVEDRSTTGIIERIRRSGGGSLDRAPA